MVEQWRIRIYTGLLLILVLFVSTATQAQDVGRYDIYSVAYSPDGSKIAVGGGASLCSRDPSDSSNFAIRILDASSGDILNTIAGPICSVNSVSWNPDGTLIASSSDEGTGSVWDATTGMLVSTYSASGIGAAELRNVAWNPLDERIVIQGGGRTTSIWNGITGKLIGPVFDDATFAVTSVAWSPDGTKLALGTLADKVEIFDMAQQSSTNYPLLLRFEAGPVFSLTWSPDGSQIATAAGFEVRLFDSATGQLKSTLIGATDNLLTVAWSDDGNYIAAAGMEGMVRLWNAATGTETEAFEYGTPILSIDWHPDGHHIAYGGFENPDFTNGVEIVDVSEPKPPEAHTATETDTPINTPMVAVNRQTPLKTNTR